MYSGVSYLLLIAEIQKAGVLTPKHLRIPLSKVGFPIRISADQSSFAAPRGFSQRSTCFIAYPRQGIDQMPFIHLIALIINAHSALGSTDPDPSCLGSHRRDTDLERPACKIEPTTPCGQAKGCQSNPPDLAIGRNAGSASRPRSFDHDRYSERSPLHDVR